MCNGRVHNTKEVFACPHDMKVREFAGQEVTFGQNDVEEVVGKSLKDSIILVNVTSENSGKKATIGLGVIDGLTIKDEIEIKEIKSSALLERFKLT